VGSIGKGWLKFVRSVLTFKSSTILFSGAGVLPMERDGACRKAGGRPPESWAVAAPTSRVYASGVGGLLSPMTAVVGRKRDAMIMRWLRSELIVQKTSNGDVEGNGQSGVRCGIGPLAWTDIGGVDCHPGVIFRSLPAETNWRRRTFLVTMMNRNGPNFVSHRITNRVHPSPPPLFWLHQVPCPAHIATFLQLTRLGSAHPFALIITTICVQAYSNGPPKHCNSSLICAHLLR
jgi:hypothetical protein